MRSRPQPSAPWADRERRVRLGAREVGEHFDALAAREMAIRLRGDSLLLHAARDCVRAALRASASVRRVGIGAQRARIGIEDDLCCRRRSPAVAGPPPPAWECRASRRGWRHARWDRRRRARCRRACRRIDVDELRGREVAREQDAAGRNLDVSAPARLRAPAAPAFRGPADRRRARRAAHRRWRSSFARWRAGSRARRSPRSCRRRSASRAASTRSGSSSNSRCADMISRTVGAAVVASRESRARTASRARSNASVSPRHSAAHLGDLQFAPPAERTQVRSPDPDWR